MFERADPRRYQIASLQRGVQGLEKTLSQLSEAVADRAPVARKRAHEAYDDVGALVDRFRDGAERVGGDALRWGRSAAKFSGASVDRFAKDVGVHPFLIVGLALGLGAIIGAARYRSVTSRPARPAVARRTTRPRKRNSK